MNHPILLNILGTLTPGQKLVGVIVAIVLSLLAWLASSMLGLRYRWRKNDAAWEAAPRRFARVLGKHATLGSRRHCHVSVTLRWTPQGYVAELPAENPMTRYWLDVADVETSETFAVEVSRDVFLAQVVDDEILYQTALIQEYQDESPRPHLRLVPA